MYVFMVPYALGGIAGPSIQGLISAQIPRNAQGELQGGLTSLMSACSIVGPPIMTALFAYFTGKDAPFWFPGAPFLLGAMLTIISALVAYKNYRRNKAISSDDAIDEDGVGLPSPETVYSEIR